MRGHGSVRGTMRGRIVAALVVGIGALALGAGPDRAQADGLLGLAGGRLDGRIGAGLGNAVGAAGDFNGDGLDDVIVGAPEASITVGPEAEDRRGGAAYVVFGRRADLLGPVPGLARDGVVIVGGERDGAAGSSVAGAGDVNGDGLDDVVVSDPRAGPYTRPLAGRGDSSVDGAAYVIYGGRAGSVDLGRLGRRGFAVEGTESGDVAGAGDVNGDALDDVVVAANDQPDGGAYVVFGRRERRSFDAAGIGSRGIRVVGAPGDLDTGPVAAAGDVNGDGLDDVVLGAPASLGRPVPPDVREPIGPGIASVVFGRRAPGTVELARPGKRGYRIEPRPAFGLTGYSVAGPGDVNGDGLDDVIVGAPVEPFDFDTERAGPGMAYVVFGDRAPVDVGLGMLGSRGLAIRGALPGSSAGAAVAGAGDVNGDGLADLIVGAPGRGYDLGTGAGRAAAFLVPSPGSEGPLELAGLAPPGLALRGVAADGAGAAVELAGDTDGDGRPELLVGAPGACSAAEEVPAAESRGAVHLIELPPLTMAPPPLGSGPDTRAGGPGPDRLASRDGRDCIYGEGGDDRLRGGGGTDALLGGSGDDRLSGAARGDLLAGGPGGDAVIGGSGADAAAGGAGADRLVGGSGRDRLDAGPAADSALAGAGDDEVDGGGGDDTLAGGRGRDFIIGDGGADRLSGGAGRDFISGYDGDDRVSIRDGHVDRVICGAGIDRVLADPSDRLHGCERQEV